MHAKACSSYFSDKIHCSFELALLGYNEDLKWPLEAVACSGESLQNLNNLIITKQKLRLALKSWPDLE